MELLFCVNSEAVAIATRFWCIDDCKWNFLPASVKVDLIRGNPNVSTSAHEGKTNREYNLENHILNGSLPNQLNQANDDIVYHKAAWVPFSGNYHGLKATLNVYKLPGVGAHQMSSTSITIGNLQDSSLSNYNGLQAGWHVAPALYGDREPHFYIYWKAGNSRCLNLRCKGFVYMNSKTYTPGSKISPVSRYNGPQYVITVKISQDPESGDWWVHAGQYSEIPVGYWPKLLLPNIIKGADFVQWGGEVSYPRGEKGPPMGSGHFPKEGSRKAAYIKDVMAVTSTGDLDYPQVPNDVQDKQECYKAEHWIASRGYFGGPGGCID